jgi:mannosylglycerate hydrolase
VPDSTGWVEEAFGTQPLRSWVDLTDGRDGLAILPKGLYEYEVCEDRERTLLLTLIRACRIKLVVSNEKQTLLSDTGIQCPGMRQFEYAILAHEGDWRTAHLPRVALEYAAPPRAAAAGRGKGDLPPEASLLRVDNPEVLVSCVKGAEDGKGLVVRLYNPAGAEQRFTMRFGCKVTTATRCRIDETAIGACTVADGALSSTIGAKKIQTFRIVTG